MMKRALSLLLAVCLLVGLLPTVALWSSAATYSGTCGTNVKWSLNTDTGVLTISGSGAMTDYAQSSKVPWYSYRNSIKTASIESGVTRIGSYAFSNCSSLTSVTIGDSVASIGDSAFRNCSSLTSVTIPDSVTSIGSYAFYSCSSLTSVTIPDSVTSIRDAAFDACDNLLRVTVLNPRCDIDDQDLLFDPKNYSDLGHLGKTVIYGYENSTAQSYAESYGHQFAVVEEAPAEAEGSNKDIIILLDNSLSMYYDTEDGSTTNRAIALEALDQFLEIVFANENEGNNRVCLITYHTTAFLHNLNKPDGYRKDANLSKEVIWGNAFLDDGDAIYTLASCAMDEATVDQSLDSSGGATNPESALLLAQQVAALRPVDTERDLAIVMFTDGKPTARLSNEYDYNMDGSGVDTSSREHNETLAAGISLRNFVESYENCESSIYSVALLNSQAESANVNEYYTMVGYLYGAGDAARQWVGTQDDNILADVGVAANWKKTTGFSDVYLPLYGDASEREEDLKELFALIASIALESEANIYSGSCGTNVWFKLNLDTGVLTISGSGAMANYVYGEAPWFSYRNSIKTIIIEDSVTSIGNYAFAYCDSLTNLTIPASVTKVGELAFGNCKTLESVAIKNPQCAIGDVFFPLWGEPVIFGYPGSTAEAFAAEMGYKFVGHLYENGV